MSGIQRAVAAEGPVEIDVRLIPQHARDELSRFALSLVDEMFSKPGAEKRYQEWLKQRKERLTAAK